MSAVNYGAVPAAGASAQASWQKKLRADVVVRGFSVLPAPILGIALLTVQVPDTCNVSLGRAFAEAGVLNIFLGCCTLAYFLHAVVFDQRLRADGSDNLDDAEERSDPVPSFSFFILLLTSCVVMGLDSVWVFGVGEVHEASGNLCGETINAFWIIFAFTIVCQFTWPVLSYLTVDPNTSDRRYVQALDYFAFVCALLLVIAALFARILTPGPPEGYSEYRSAQFAKLAGAAYCPSANLEKWNCGENCFLGVSDVNVCSGSTTKALVAKWESLCVLSFEGTSNYQSMITDLRYYKSSANWEGCNDCKVHTGFLKEWESLESCVQDSLVQSKCRLGAVVSVTGHSLGAAVSTIAAVALEQRGWRIAEVYNFGSPRVGNLKFGKEITRRFRGRFFRVTHHMDPVPHVPPRSLLVSWHFQHVEPEIFYDGNVSDGSVTCRWDGDRRCSSKYSSLITNSFHIDDHGTYMGTYIGSLGCKRPPMSSLDNTTDESNSSDANGTNTSNASTAD